MENKIEACEKFIVENFRSPTVRITDLDSFITAEVDSFSLNTYNIFLKEFISISMDTKIRDTDYSNLFALKMALISKEFQIWATREIRLKRIMGKRELEKEKKEFFQKTLVKVNDLVSEDKLNNYDFKDYRNEKKKFYLRLFNEYEEAALITSIILPGLEEIIFYLPSTKMSNTIKKRRLKVFTKGIFKILNKKGINSDLAKVLQEIESKLGNIETYNYLECFVNKLRSLHGILRFKAFFIELLGLIEKGYLGLDNLNIKLELTTDGIHDVFNSILAKKIFESYIDNKHFKACTGSLSYIYWKFKEANLLRPNIIQSEYTLWVKESGLIPMSAIIPIDKIKSKVWPVVYEESQKLHMDNTYFTNYR
jgi:hypothetical protein